MSVAMLSHWCACIWVALPALRWHLSREADDGGDDGDGDGGGGNWDDGGGDGQEERRALLLENAEEPFRVGTWLEPLESTRGPTREYVQALEFALFAMVMSLARLG